MEFYTVTLQHIHYCNYGYSVIDGDESRKIYRLSDNERAWIEIEEIEEIEGIEGIEEIEELPKKRFFGVASLNGKIYITGGDRSLILYDK